MLLGVLLLVYGHSGKELTTVFDLHMVYSYAIWLPLLMHGHTLDRVAVLLAYMLHGAQVLPAVCLCLAQTSPNMSQTAPVSHCLDWSV